MLNTNELNQTQTRNSFFESKEDTEMSNEYQNSTSPSLCINAVGIVFSGIGFCSFSTMCMLLLQSPLLISGDVLIGSAFVALLFAAMFINCMYGAFRAIFDKVFNSTSNPVLTSTPSL